MRVLIVAEGRSTGALAAVRSLGKSAVEVDVASPDRRSLAGASRHCRGSHVVPSPARDVRAFVRSVAETSAREGHDVVLPGGDAELLALSEHRRALPPGTTLPYPAHEVVERIVDKSTLAAAATEVGLRVPAVDPLSLPVVVKARRHWGAGARQTRHEVCVARSPEERSAAIRAIRADGGEAIVQERVDGDLVALVLLIGRDGRVAGRVQQRALRTNPRDGGVSARAITEPIAQRMADQAVELLRGVGWWGPAQLQFVDDGSGRPALVDVNARLYGSMWLATQAGVDVSGWWVREAMGSTMVDPGDARVGVRYQWVEGALRAAAASGELLDVIRWWPGSCGPLAQAGDPLPAAVHATDLAGRAVRKLRRRFFT